MINYVQIISAPLPSLSLCYYPCFNMFYDVMMRSHITNSQIND